MPSVAVRDNERISLRVPAEDKARLLRAAELYGTGLTEFLLRHALAAANEVVKKAERVRLSERDSLRVLDLLQNPPAPNEKLLAAAKELPRQS